MRIYFFIFFGLILTGCNSENNRNDPTPETNQGMQVDNQGATNIDSQTVVEMPLESLSVEEELSLRFMREEEKLARDVYLSLFDIWNQNTFKNIADSEQTHTDTVKALIDKYQIADPVIEDTRGQFENADLQSLYHQLTIQGSSSLIEALKVGALIEEIDIIDIENAQQNAIDNEDINLAYDNLKKGSRNHLRAFVSVLEKQGESYQPQKLSQSVYDSIIQSEIETN